MSLPYQNATSGQAAINDIRKILQRFGCQSFGVMDDYQKGEVVIVFTHRDRPITVKASMKGYAAAWLRENPWSDKRKSTQQQWTDRALQVASIAVYSVLRDWIKGQMTAIEIGILPFEAAFLAQTMLPDGQTVMEKIEQAGGLLQITGR